ncbi:formate dehydrogenase subunit delta [Breoghania corrubedonensis]|uniref:Formate dehydrogenase subunit delta n=1 Tax=Breoghania corrubedonensis TaxID=665038 RepID=A0A2T5V7V3_9HYPH|nr:formate dehydrogenase subunit delta [Breoghania corrubedonensis]PTW59843.1 formate dehydrogenase subunit delta [Breoghania corrubedonensis]
MSAAKLVYKANQIATFFQSQSPDEAAAGVAAHINKFWEPRMRRQLADILRHDDNGLKPLVIEAAGDIHFPQTTS